MRAIESRELRLLDITLSRTRANLIKIAGLTLDEFLPVVRFNRGSLDWNERMRVIESERSITLSNLYRQENQIQKIWSITMLPGAVSLPFTIESGAGTWDKDGHIEARVEPATEGVRITRGAMVKARYGEGLSLDLQIEGHAVRTFKISFYANDDEEDFNRGEYGNVHCGSIEISVSGSSRVGFRLLSNFDALPKAPAGYQAPQPLTEIKSEIELSQIQANQYQDCEGVCYATTAARAQKAYRDEIGAGIIDLTVSNKNVDHRIASTQGGNDPFMGYGAGGAFARHGYGETVDNAGVWSGQLKPGALLQKWNSTDMTDLFGNGGHSVIFRNYVYDEKGDVTGLEYSDYHGGTLIYPRSGNEFTRTFMGVNLLDAPK